MNHSYPQHTTIQRFWLPTLRATIALERKNGDQAFELLSVTRPYELSAISAAPLEPAYLRGQAYLIQHNGAAALVEFQKIIDHPGVLDTEGPSVGPLVHLGIARAYGLEGDTAKSRIAYQNVLALWKDADLRHSHSARGQGRVCKIAVSMCWLWSTGLIIANCVPSSAPKI